jgi:hypothetical protein
VIRPPRALAVVDAGAATTAVAVLGRPGERWRLLGSLAAPAGVPEGELLGVLAERLRSTDPELAAEVGLDPASIDDIPWLASRSAAPRTIAALGASRRSVALLEGVLARTPWRIEAASTETHDPREMTELVLRPDVAAVLVSTGDPPGPDERPALDDLAGLVGAAARRRPELQVIVGDAVRARRTWIDGLGSEPGGDPARIVSAPPIGARRTPDERLRVVLDALVADPLDGRGALRAVASSLADLLDRRIEILEVGHDGGARVMAAPGVAGGDPTSTAVATAGGALIPAALGEELVDQVLAWTTGSLDRHRMADRLRDLRSAPWSDASGDGARLRLAAARAALARIAGVTPEMAAQPAPDLTILAGGAFAAAPAAAVALAAADTIRRAGATQLGMDPARLLGPIGTIEDPGERRALLADVLGDLLVPLGSLVLAAGVRPRRDDAPAGRMILDRDGSPSRHELAAGDLAFIDLPPGARAQASFEFRAAVRLGGRARRVSVPVTGGLAGLIVDLRDVPLRLPERRDRRRALLAAWSAMAWPADGR